MSSSNPPPPPARNQAKKMHISDSNHAVVRLHPGTQLETAFRVHLMTETLQEANLKTGDICEISADDGTTGYGIAWRADDRAGNRPKTRPAKMTEIFKNAFGFLDGSRVTISQTNAKTYPAEKMVLSEVTPPDSNSSNDMDAGKWEIRVKNLFVGCEALAPGISFEVPGSKAKSRKRFYIESIESREASADSASLYSFQSNTDVTFSGGIAVADTANDMTQQSRPNGVSRASSSNHVNGALANGVAEMSVTTAQPQYQLNAERIGGLLEQCRALNQHLRFLLAKAEDFNCPPARVPNHSILLHGYEGTGKTMLLKKLAEAPFRKVVHVNTGTLPGGTISANKKFIKESFADAINEQPSLILFDNLDRLAPPDDQHYSTVIESELANIRNPGMRVLVVGATRSPSNVHACLLGPGMFSTSLELPVPNLEAREQILNVLRGKPVFTKDTLSSKIAERTHGFTAKDVALLSEKADYLAFKRFDDECAEQAMARSPTPPAYHEINNGSTSIAGGCCSQPSYVARLEDFEAALKGVKPTALREIFTERPTTKWTDIGGSDAIKERFDEAIEWSLKDKEQMMKMNISTPKGILLYGPPGCSKTLTAQAVANTYNLNFIAIKGAELVNMYVGESERQVREVFRKAKQAAPCVVFFDEIDAIGSDRDSTGTKGLNVLTTLLNEMDGFEALRDVFILAATNKPASLDSALLRPGRFDSHIYLGPPNETARKEIIMLATRGNILAKEVNFDTLATDLDGWSGAEIVRIVHDAKMSAYRRSKRDPSLRVEDMRVEAADFEAARRGVRKGITKEMLQELEDFASQQSPK